MPGKQVFLLVTCATLMLVSCSSSTEFDIKQSDAPPNVLSAFKAKYSSAENAEREAKKEDARFYSEPDFKDGDKEIEVHIRPDGVSITKQNK